MRLTERGLEIFPQLPLRAYLRSYEAEQISSGIMELDALLHGGVMRETITLVTGPTGVGKTTLGLQFMREAASRGERSLICLFEEWDDMLLERSESISIPVRAMREAGSLFIEQVEPLYYTADDTLKPRENCIKLLGSSRNGQPTLSNPCASSRSHATALR